MDQAQSQSCRLVCLVRVTGKLRPTQAQDPIHSFKKYLFTFILLIFGCAGSLLLCTGFV